MSDTTRLADIRQRVAAELEWRGGPDEEFWCRDDRKWLLHEVDKLAALVEAKERVTQRILREQMPERTPRTRRNETP